MPSGDHFLQARQRYVREYGHPQTGAPVPAPPPAEPSNGADKFMVLTLEVPPQHSDGRFDDALFAGLGAQWLDRAAELLENVDGVRCWRCGVGVGFLLAGDADEHVRWGEASLVSGPGPDPVSIQCAECAPATCPQPWPTEQPPGWAAMRPDHCWLAPDGATRVHVQDPGAVACRCGRTEPRRAPVVS